MANRKGGLHKKISSIFDGVPVPQRDEPQEAESQRNDPGSAPERSEQAPSVSQSRPTAGHGVRRQSHEKHTAGFLQRQGKKILKPPAGVSAKRQKTMVFLLCALAVVFIVVVFRLLSPSTRHRKTQAPVSPPNDNVVSLPQGQGSEVEETTIDWQIPEVVIATQRDPMYVEGQESPVTEEEKRDYVSDIFVVHSILYSETKGWTAGVAISNKKDEHVTEYRIVHEGERLSDAIVAKINGDSVEFERNGRRWTVRPQRQR